MSEITPEKTHALLAKLAEYVMEKIPQIEARLDQKADKADLIKLENKVNRLNDKVNLLLEGMDAQAKRLDIISIDMRAVSQTLDGHENRLGHLEEKVLGYRIRDDKEDYKK